MPNTISLQNTNVEGFTRKEEWKREGKGFIVLISRHEVPISRDENGEPYWSGPQEGPYRWALYAYIYPKHPHFENFYGTHQLQDATDVMMFHGGCSYLRYHYDGDGKVMSVQAGCDYNHIHDHNTQSVLPQDVPFIFEDANVLFDWLTQYGEEV